MVNNNQIPIEVNKKPVETVYEIKDEYKVPSFEEFMKSYESDGSLNYSDLESGNVGEVGGYGPCSHYSCSTCSCPRSDCNCRYDERWVDLKMSCPATGCGNPEKTYWVHSTDSYRIRISDQARIRCNKSYCSTDHVAYWSFKCSNYNFHKGQYKETDESSFSKALYIAMETKNIDFRFSTKLFKYLNENEWPKK